MIIPGKWRLSSKGAHPLVPGDRVTLKQTACESILMDLLPRTNEFSRRAPGSRKPVPQTIASNLDLVVVIASVNNPTTPMRLVDRLLVTALIGGVKPILVINKADLVSDDVLESWRVNFEPVLDVVLITSAITQQGIEALFGLIAGRTVLFAGSSGVGKSSLANCLDPGLDLKTRQISSSTGKGRHTTSATQLHPIRGGGWIADTPGLRECAPWGMTRHKLAEVFPGFEAYSGDCRFRDCVHGYETGCGVKSAVEQSKLPVQRYESYLKLLSEAELK